MESPRACQKWCCTPVQILILLAALQLHCSAVSLDRACCTDSAPRVKPPASAGPHRGSPHWHDSSEIREKSRILLAGPLPCPPGTLETEALGLNSVPARLWMSLEDQNLSQNLSQNHRIYHIMYHRIGRRISHRICDRITESVLESVIDPIYPRVIESVTESVIELVIESLNLSWNHRIYHRNYHRNYHSI